MVETIFSKKILLGIVIILTGIIFTLVWDISKQQKEINQFKSPSLDFSLEKKLREKVKQALSTYSQRGWNKTVASLEDIRLYCKRRNCNFEAIFNEFLDTLASTVSSNQEFTSGASTLGIIYPGNWKIADLDRDGENEIVILQRDTLNPTFILLKVIDFQNKPRVVNFKLNESYFSSPNSSGSSPLEIINTTPDSNPVILTFVSGSKGGAHLYVFRYKDGKLSLLLKKDDLFYPEYIFTGKEKNGFSEIIVRGNTKDGEKVTQHLNVFNSILDERK